MRSRKTQSLEHPSSKFLFRRKRRTVLSGQRRTEKVLHKREMESQHRPHAPPGCSSSKIFLTQKRDRQRWTVSTDHTHLLDVLPRQSSSSGPFLPSFPATEHEKTEDKDRAQCHTAQMKNQVSCKLEQKNRHVGDIQTGG